ELDTRARDAAEHDGRAARLALGERKTRDVLGDVVDLVEAAHRDVARVEGADGLGNVLQALRALGRGDDDLAEADDRCFGRFLRCSIGCCHGQGGRNRRRKRLRARAPACRDSHVLPPAGYLRLATCRLPGKPPPVARRMAATYQSMNSCVNVSITADSGPGS